MMKIVIPQDDLYVITWDTNFEELTTSNEEITVPTRLDTADNPNSFADHTNPPDEIFTDVDLRSTGPHESEKYDPTEKTRSESSNDRVDYHQSSGGSDTIVPEVSDDENDDMILENENPRGVKYNLQHNTTLNITDEYRY